MTGIHYLENQTCYLNSKSDDSCVLTGNFEVTEKKLNKRTKIIHFDTKQPYWVKSLSIGAPRIEQQPVDHVYHVVKRGDTIQTIANQYGISASDLARRVTSLAVGMKIIVK